MQPKSRHRTTLIRLLAAIGVAATLGGCIIVPVGPGYYRPHPHYGYY